MGNESPKDLIMHFVEVAKLTIDEEIVDFSNGFLSDREIDDLIKTTYTDIHSRYINAGLS